MQGKAILPSVLCNRDGEFRKLQITIQTDTLHVWIYRYSQAKNNHYRLQLSKQKHGQLESSLTAPGGLGLPSDDRSSSNWKIRGRCLENQTGCNSGITGGSDWELPIRAIAVQLFLVSFQLEMNGAFDLVRAFSDRLGRWTGTSKP